MLEAGGMHESSSRFFKEKACMRAAANASRRYHAQEQPQVLEGFSMDESSSKCLKLVACMRVAAGVLRKQHARGWQQVPGGGGMRAAAVASLEMTGTGGDRHMR
ncbi:hypothetical protein DUNSADRAFT_6466 [Dunaliella salina]|uniref:Encoded protein n=1 Tax=Dunaliella salina TaxID=3046 RepID=A0ABQ7GNA7_DUNSA|nr:hypothetical protein DUNSADRAFT_6466 [Dunaliella salina]|eukprot:KAF5836096.1 hypothetical protein DUNSADRAFT_6466 [Dunaliella salina]